METQSTDHITETHHLDEGLFHPQVVRPLVVVQCAQVVENGAKGHRTVLKGVNCLCLSKAKSLIGKTHKHVLKIHQRLLEQGGRGARMFEPGQRAGDHVDEHVDHRPEEKVNSLVCLCRVL